MTVGKGTLTVASSTGLRTGVLKHRLRDLTPGRGPWGHRDGLGAQPTLSQERKDRSLPTLTTSLWATRTDGSHKASSDEGRKAPKGVQAHTLPHSNPHSLVHAHSPAKPQPAPAGTLTGPFLYVQRQTPPDPQLLQTPTPRPPGHRLSLLLSSLRFLSAG